MTFRSRSMDNTMSLIKIHRTVCAVYTKLSNVTCAWWHGSRSGSDYTMYTALQCTQLSITLRRFVVVDVCLISK